MDKFITVSIDAMGGDNAPMEIVKGAIDAINKSEDIKVKLFGNEEAINAELSKYQFDKSKVEVVATTEIIETAEAPVNAIRNKKDSSLVRAIRSVREKEADAVISAGCSGAVLVGGQVLVGKAKGVSRAPFAPLIPTKKGVSLMLDCGANVDARPDHLAQFAKIGSIYMENVMGVKNPKVALVNIGAEEEKGNALTKETYKLLKEMTDINFVGNIEARDIPAGEVDVIVCEAFVGNVILKLYEGLGLTLMGIIKEGLMSTTRSKLGAALAKPALKQSLKKFDVEEHGGAPLLGLNALVLKCHGSAKSIEIANSVLQCKTFIEEDIVNKVLDSFKDE